MGLKDSGITKAEGWFALFCCALIVLIVEITRPKFDPQKDSCVSCHINTSNPDISHNVKAMGCSVCHLGNAFAYHKNAAHVGIVKNPSDLSTVEFTCGRSNCHNEIPSKVKNSVMATNSGMLKSLKELWIHMGNEDKDWPKEILDLKKEGFYHWEVLDYFKKMCGSCHLWRKVGDVEGEMGLKGGGCSACHVIRTEKTKDLGTKAQYQHPVITAVVPPENCLKCHNRSARIATSYKGMMEVLGTKGELNERPGENYVEYGGRRYLQLFPDIHHRKAGLWCIDCHNGQELMGDGQRHPELESQLDSHCTVCHSHIEESRIQPPNDLAKKLVSLNKRLPQEQHKILYTPKGYPLYHIRHMEGKLVLFRKADGFPFELTVKKNAPYHRLKGHERLSCSACHSAWMPQCFGCHIVREEGMQWDWVLTKGSMGRWVERVDFIRHAEPPLGVKKDKIYPIFSHPVYLWMKEKPALGVSLVLPSFDPHTTQKEAKSCWSCHGDARSVGLNGVFLDKEVHEHLFEKSQGHKRGFKEEEVERILRVGQCIVCHKDYQDPIFRDFQISYIRFCNERNLPCRIGKKVTCVPFPFNPD